MKMKLFVVLILCVVVVVSNASSGSLLASPSILSHNGDAVTLQYSNIPSSDDTDFIAVFSPPDNTYPINAVEVDGTSSGTVTVAVANIRNDYQFVYMRAADNAMRAEIITAVRSRNLKKKPSDKYLGGTPIATSGVVSFANSDEPTQAHFAQTNDPTKMLLTWGSAAQSGFCSYWPASGSPSQATTVPTKTSTYTMQQMCEYPANSTDGFRDPGFIHRCVLTNLVPGTKYAYKYGINGGTVIQGSNLVFSAVPAPGTLPRTLNIAVFGDMGVSKQFGEQPGGKSYKHSGATASYLAQESAAGQLDSILFIGDLSYANGFLFRWEQWLLDMKPVLDNVPIHVSVGNHEYDYLGQPFHPSWSDYGSDSGGECGVPYNSRFLMPSVSYGSASSNQAYWYSYTLGLLHILVISTEHDFTVGSPQYNFILSDLQNVNKTATPFLIVGGHRPMYTSYSSKAPELTTHLVDALEPLFVQYGVDACFWGHVHDYERTCRIVNGECNNSGPMHFVVGGAGNSDEGKKIDPQPAWSLIRNHQYGYGRLIMDTDSLSFQYISDEDNGNVYDKVVIKEL